MPKLNNREKETLSDALKDASKSSLEACFLHRLHCVQLVAQGSSAQEVAHLFNDDPSSVARWVRHFKAFGVEGLRDDQKPGRPASLDPDQLRALQQLLGRTPAAALGYGGDHWSGKLLASHVEEQYGLSLSVRQCQRLLRQLQELRAKQKQYGAGLADDDKVLLLSPVSSRKPQ